MLTENSFHVQFTANEIITYYEIVPKEAHFIVAVDNRVIAEISINGYCKQLTGTSLPGELFQSICKQIDSIKSRSGTQDILPEK